MDPVRRPGWVREQQFCPSKVDPRGVGGGSDVPLLLLFVLSFVPLRPGVRLPESFQPFLELRKAFRVEGKADQQGTPGVAVVGPSVIIEGSVYRAMLEGFPGVDDVVGDARVVGVVVLVAIDAVTGFVVVVIVVVVVVAAAAVAAAAAG